MELCGNITAGLKTADKYFIILSTATRRMMPKLDHRLAQTRIHDRTAR